MKDLFHSSDPFFFTAEGEEDDRRWKSASLKDVERAADRKRTEGGSERGRMYQILMASRHKRELSLEQVREKTLVIRLRQSICLRVLPDLVITSSGL